jgi:hypothetical protein
MRTQGKRLSGETRRRTVAASGGPHSQRCCNEVCRFFLGESAKKPGRGLCYNPNYVRLHEACLSVMGQECDYYITGDSDSIDLRHISFEYTGRENREFSRDLTYNFMLLQIVRGTEMLEYPSVILDVSLGGIGCIVPITMESLPQEFCLIKNVSLGNMIKLICRTRRVIKHSSVTEIGASFKEQISEDILASLLKTGSV